MAYANEQKESPIKAYSTIDPPIATVRPAPAPYVRPVVQGNWNDPGAPVSTMTAEQARYWGITSSPTLPPLRSVPDSAPLPGANYNDWYVARNPQPRATLPVDVTSQPVNSPGAATESPIRVSKIDNGAFGTAQDGSFPGGQLTSNRSYTPDYGVTNQSAPVATASMFDFKNPITMIVVLIGVIFAAVWFGRK